MHMCWQLRQVVPRTKSRTHFHRLASFPLGLFRVGVHVRANACFVSPRPLGLGAACPSLFDAHTKTEGTQTPRAVIENHGAPRSCNEVRANIACAAAVSAAAFLAAAAQQCRHLWMDGFRTTPRNGPTILGSSISVIIEKSLSVSGGSLMLDHGEKTAATAAAAAIGGLTVIQFRSLARSANSKIAQPWGRSTRCLLTIGKTSWWPFSRSLWPCSRNRPRAWARFRHFHEWLWELGALPPCRPLSSSCAEFNRPSHCDR